MQFRAGQGGLSICGPHGFRDNGRSDAEAHGSLRFVLIAVAGRMNQRQLRVIDHLREENRVLRERLGGRRLRLRDGRRRRLAARATLLGRRALAEVATIVTPETLAWHRKLIAPKYDGSGRRRSGGPKLIAGIGMKSVMLPPRSPDPPVAQPASSPMGPDADRPASKK